LIVFVLMDVNYYKIIYFSQLWEKLRCLVLRETKQESLPISREFFEEKYTIQAAWQAE